MNITAGYIMAGYVTAGYIKAGYITAGYITTGYITAGYIRAACITAGYITACLKQKRPYLDTRKTEITFDDQKLSARFTS